MPKILCLHGHGTSAHIFKSQTAAFRRTLPPSYTFDFISAPFPSPPAAGISAIYPDAPTYTWYRETTPSGLCDAHRHILDYIAKNGPYDVIMGFSQGCSLIGSLLLYHSYDKHHQQPNTKNRNENGNGGDDGIPFKAAIFICGGIPLYALRDMGLPISSAAEEINKATGALLQNTATSLSTYASDISLIKRGVGLWDGNVSANSLIHDPGVRPPRDDVFGLDFTSFPDWATITIPTVHVYGAKDPRWPAGVQLAEFCSDKVEFDHGGGHDIPRGSAVSERIGGMVEELLRRI
ncbi:serine hydrolase FSH [Aspergillus multicolor]|uniref:serine hydrolase FSH n=1 Tax=Aspergillus multicolor TaxID=41759 RepID=UPI003CCE4F0E